MARLCIICIELILLVIASSLSLNIEGSSKRVLVLLDNLATRETHSFYFNKLKGANQKRIDSQVGVQNEFEVRFYILTIE